MNKVRRLTPVEVIDAFVDHPDTISAIKSWAQGHFSDQELIDRLVATQIFIDTTPVEEESEGLDGFWEAM